MRPKIVLDRPVPAEVLAYLSQHFDCTMWDRSGPMPDDLLYDALAEAQGLVTSSRRIDEALLARAPKLKAVSTISVGYNHFDIAAMKARGIIGTNTPNVLNETVADLAFALILAAARRVAELDRYVKDGRWRREDNESLFGVDVHHATLGIIGMGRIGEAIARRARLGFRMDVVYYNRGRKPEAERELDIAYKPMDELLRTSDFILLMTPLTPETTKLIGREQFRLMKRSAIFINVSRGQTVDEAALIEALREGTIRGAGLDVYESEPVSPDNPLLAMPNVVTLPHIGSATAKTRFDMAMLAARNLAAALGGQVPPDLVSELKE